MNSKARDTVADDATAIAESLIAPTDTDRHFAEQARTLLIAQLILGAPQSKIVAEFKAEQLATTTFRRNRST